MDVSNGLQYLHFFCVSPTYKTLIFDFLFCFSRASELQENGKGSADVSSTPDGTKKVFSNHTSIQEL